MTYPWSHVEVSQLTRGHREVPVARKQCPAGETSESERFHWENQSQLAAVRAPARHVNMEDSVLVLNSSQRAARVLQRATG